MNNGNTYRLRDGERKTFVVDCAYSAIETCLSISREHIWERSRKQALSDARHPFVVLVTREKVSERDIAAIDNRARDRTTLMHSRNVGETIIQLRQYKLKWERLWNTFQTNMSSSASCAAKTATSSCAEATSMRKTENI